MQEKIKRKIIIIINMLFMATLLTGFSQTTKITLNEQGAGTYEESLSISKDLWDMSIAKIGNDNVITSYFQTIYPNAQITLSNVDLNGITSKTLGIKMNFKNEAQFQQIMSARNLFSVKFNSKYFTKSSIYMPLDEDTTNTSSLDEWKALLDTDSNLITEEMQNINVTTTITFPYAVQKTNGKIQPDGKTVIWNTSHLEDSKRLYALFNVSNSISLPTYTGAANGKNYNTGVTVMIDSNNLLNNVTVNKEKIESDCLFLTEEGYYTVIASDINGHKSKIKFRIDTTAPVVRGVSNGKSYKTLRTIQFSDPGSGIEKATLNGKSIQTGKKVTKKGKYKLIVTDKANNTTKIIFTLK